MSKIKEMESQQVRQKVFKTKMHALQAIDIKKNSLNEHAITVCNSF